jgi:Asp-tRNA(Asn)/Glu-tRNA(Gln) amidotransferase A subunit family amidase
MANAAGYPALVIPFAGGGIPAGVQIAARVGCDRALLALGARLAAVAPVVDYPYPIAGHP